MNTPAQISISSCILMNIHLHASNLMNLQLNLSLSGSTLIAVSSLLPHSELRLISLDAAAGHMMAMLVLFAFRRKQQRYPCVRRQVSLCTLQTGGNEDGGGGWELPSNVTATIAMSGPWWSFVDDEATPPAFSASDASEERERPALYL